MKLVNTGLRYCIRHQGVVDCDEDVCDFSRDDDDGRDGAPRACVMRQLVYRSKR